MTVTYRLVILLRCGGSGRHRGRSGLLGHHRRLGRGEELPGLGSCGLRGWELGYWGCSWSLLTQSSAETVTQLLHRNLEVEKIQPN